MSVSPTTQQLLQNIPSVPTYFQQQVTGTANMYAGHFLNQSAR